MACSEKIRRFRLATINVHGFENPRKHEYNIDDLVSILRPLNLDFLTVQEIDDEENWDQLCQLLSLPNFIFGPSEGDYCGNGMASRYTIRSYNNQKFNKFCQGGTRSLFQCSLDGLENVTFAVTHLDYLDEDDRLSQIKEFNPQKTNIDILMGDMNSLTREDYSEKYFIETILKKREQSQWEKARFDLTKLITDDWNYQDAFKLRNSKLKDEQIATCEYGTRIDYIYLHPRLNDQWTLTQCSIIDTKGATDHQAVFAEFELKSK